MVEEKVFISMSIGDLQTIIIDCVNACLKHHQFGSEAPSSDYVGITGAMKTLDLSSCTIYKLVRDKNLPYVKGGNGKKYTFSIKQLIEWANNNKHPLHNI